MAHHLAALLKTISQCDNDAQRAIYLAHLLDLIMTARKRGGDSFENRYKNDNVVT